MNIRNLNHIEELKSQVIIILIVSCIALMPCIVFLYIVVKYLLYWKSKKGLKNVKISLEEILRKIEDGLQSREGIVNNS